MVFTGLIEEVAEVLKRTDHGLLIARPATFNDIRIGSSIAVSGACLTIASLTDQSMGFDVHEETWARTKLGTLNNGDVVNLERALKAGERFEGHIVQGHIDATGTVVGLVHPPSPTAVAKAMTVRRLRGAGGHVDGVGEIRFLRASPPERTSREAMFTIEYPSSLRGLIVEKGSIAVDGVSLTIAHVDDEAFTVALIPET